MEQRNGGIENHCAFHSGLDADLDFTVVDQVGANALNVRGRPVVEVCGTKNRAQNVGLGLAKKV